MQPDGSDKSGREFAPRGPVRDFALARNPDIPGTTTSRDGSKYAVQNRGIAPFWSDPKDLRTFF
jgi:hypothetical protein